MNTGNVCGQNLRPITDLANFNIGRWEKGTQVNLCSAHCASDKTDANNKGTDQTAHPLSLMSAFVIRSPESILHVPNFNILASPCSWAG